MGLTHGSKMVVLELNVKSKSNDSADRKEKEAASAANLQNEGSKKMSKGNECQESTT